MHSPWGLIGLVAKETGWTYEYILWRVSRVNLLLLLADRPGVKRQKAKSNNKKVSGKEFARLMGK